MADTTTVAPQTTSSAKYHLLDLPAELRLNIYNHAFATMPIDFLQIQRHSRLPTHALLATSKTLRFDAGKAYFDRMYGAVAKLRKQVDEADVEYERPMVEKRETTNEFGKYHLLQLVTETFGRIQHLDKRCVRVKRLVDDELKKWREEGLEYGKKIRG